MGALTVADPDRRVAVSVATSRAWPCTLPLPPAACRGEVLRPTATPAICTVARPPTVACVQSWGQVEAVLYADGCDGARASGGSCCSAGSQPWRHLDGGREERQGLARWGFKGSAYQAPH